MFLVVVNDERGALVCERELRTELSIGRTTENDIILQSASVSRRHAVLFIDHDSVFIQDLGSVNGVQVDEISVQGSVQVTEQSVVKIGTFKLFIEYVSPAESERGGFQTAVVHPNKAHGKIIMINGPQAGKEFYLFEPITSVGRTEENDITIAHISVSRHHARLKLEDNGSYIITDPNSSNGTFVRNTRVMQGIRARHGDKIRFGQIECILVDPMGQAVNRGAGISFSTKFVIGAIVAILLGLFFSEYLFSLFNL
jgi:pSer/pThr/pTyr-binding forkhead associated (FHA) protein